MSAALGALLVVGGLAAALAIVRRRGPRMPPAIAVEARIPLGKESGVALVRFGGRELLVGYGSAGVSALGEREEARP